MISEVRVVNGGIAAIACLLCVAGFVLEFSQPIEGDHTVLYGMGAIAFEMISELCFTERRSEKLGLKFMFSRLIYNSLALAVAAFAFEKFR